MRSWLSVALLLCSIGCDDDEPLITPDASSMPDAALAECHFPNGATCGGSSSANRGCTIDHCNWCDCGPGWGNTNVASCTLVGCGAPDAGPADGRCQSDADCQPGVACIFNVGCEQPSGFCNTQTHDCPHTPHAFTVCDCSGQTRSITVESCAPNLRYAHTGACP
jgi:hypothetical protein